jgi:NADPH2:quinone reductase
MKALWIARHGGPEVLEIRDVPEPAAGPDEVLVRVRASGLNRADLLQRRGLYPPPPGVPAEIPGLELAGEVEACGARVTSLRPGDRVMAIVAGAGQAEYCALHGRMALPIPGEMSFEDAAAIPEAFLTAYDALFARGRLRPGETVLIHAAASGVGLAAAAIAAASGAKVIALTRSEEKRRRLADLGYDTTRPTSGVDVVIDFVGASTWAQNLEVLAPKGRLVLVGTMSGSKVEAELSPIMRKRLTIVGTVLRSRPIEEKIALTREFSRTILPLIAGGRIRPVVDRVLPLSRAADAHGAMERNENFGKIVLTL